MAKPVADMTPQEVKRLYTEEPLSMADVGARFARPVSRQRVHQILDAAGVTADQSMRLRIVAIRMRCEELAQEARSERQAERSAALTAAVEQGTLKKTWRALGFKSYSSAVYSANYLGLSVGKPRRIPAQDYPLLARAAINGEIATVWRSLGYKTCESAKMGARVVVALHGLRLPRRKALYFLRANPGSKTSEVRAGTGAALLSSARRDLFKCRGKPQRWYLTKKAQAILREWDAATSPIKRETAK